MVNSYVVRPQTGVVPLPSGLSMAYKWGLLANYLLTGMLLHVSVGRRVAKDGQDMFHINWLDRFLQQISTVCFLRRKHLASSKPLRFPDQKDGLPLRNRNQSIFDGRFLVFDIPWSKVLGTQKCPKNADTEPHVRLFWWPGFSLT